MDYRTSGASRERLLMSIPVEGRIQHGNEYLRGAPAARRTEAMKMIKRARRPSIIDRAKECVGKECVTGWVRVI